MPMEMPTPVLPLSGVSSIVGGFFFVSILTLYVRLLPSAFPNAISLVSLSPSKNPVRKLREILIARRLEAELTKQRILELYLNVIEWGDDIYGAEAAARTYFGKSAAELSPQEAALLAGAIINPHIHSPAHPIARLRRRQQMIMRRMGAVTPPPVVAESPAARPAETPTVPVPDAPAPAPAGATPPSALPGEPVPPAPPLPPCERPPCELSE